jgi:uncharacterized membrane protein YfcA
MMLWVVCFVSFGASLLTFFSGFGLGTILLPVFALFFPLPVAIAATAVVHLANNLFKLGLIGRHARASVVLRFGAPAAVAAFGGAWLLLRLAMVRPLFRYELGGRAFEVEALGLVLAGLIALFALVELLPAFRQLQFEPRWLGLGGLLSGFFGGLSGHQGALRSAFLAKSGLGREAFIGTGVACAVIVDAVRLGVYGLGSFAQHLEALQVHEGGRLVAAATLSAFAGAYAGRRLLHKMTLHSIQTVVGIMLLLLALGIGSGLL